MESLYYPSYNMITFFNQLLEFIKEETNLNGFKKALEKCSYYKFYYEIEHLWMMILKYVYMNIKPDSNQLQIKP